MSKDPAFLFYPNDYLGGTMGFSFEQHGMYLILLIYQFNQGAFDFDIAQSLCQNKFDSIKNKFSFDEISGKYFNQRLKDEMEKREKYSQSRRENISKRYGKSTYVEHMNNICSTHVVHMENENENRNEDINTGKEEESREEEKPKTWRTDFDLYAEEAQKSARELLANESWLAERQKYHPWLDIRLSVTKAMNDYWLTEAGWAKKKAKRTTKSIDWEATINNALSMTCNQVRRPVPARQR